MDLETRYETLALSVSNHHDEQPGMYSNLDLYEELTDIKNEKGIPINSKTAAASQVGNADNIKKNNCSNVLYSDYNQDKVDKHTQSFAGELPPAICTPENTKNSPKVSKRRCILIGRILLLIALVVILLVVTSIITVVVLNKINENNNAVHVTLLTTSFSPTSINSMTTTIHITTLTSANVENSINLALGRPVYQSSFYIGCCNPSLERAVDGNTDQNFFHNSCSGTNEDTKPWWQVDLGRFIQVTNVTIFARSDCCAYRLSNFTIGITNLTGTPVIGQYAICGSYYSIPPNGAIITVVCSSSIAPGRLVFLQIPGYGAFELCEVQVYGHTAV